MPSMIRRDIWCIESVFKIFNFRKVNSGWPLYSKENPFFYIFNAEGDENKKTEKIGRGPSATACAFWNNYIPRLRLWAGECILNIFPFLNENFAFFNQ